MTKDLTIEIHRLRKTFGSFVALDDLSLQVSAGEIAGFLGPNGAGKSTTIRVLLGLLRSDSGLVKLLGGDPWADAVSLHRRLAYVPGDVSLWPGLSGGEIIDILGRLRGGLDPHKRNELIERFQFDPTKKARTYSKGNRQKVALIAALSSQVDLLVLDEPTSGLDPLMEEVFTDCIRETRAAGTSVLLSSHILAEVEKLCDTVTIIRQGKTVQSGTLDELRHLTRSTITATVSKNPARLRELAGVHSFTSTGDEITFSVDNTELDETIQALSQLQVRSLVCTPPSLEELFLRHYGDDPEVSESSSREKAGRKDSAK